jgi:fructokinase
MILVAGEALIDLVWQDTSQSFVPKEGGAPYNVAIALARQELPVAFLGPLSNDIFGDQLYERLTTSGAELAIARRVDEPTPLAVVTVDQSGNNQYRFYRNGTADRMISKELALPCLNDTVKCLQIGGTCLASEEEFAVWMTLIKSARNKGILVSVDPNIRLSLANDQTSYRRRVLSVLEHADLVKCSDEDADFLWPNQNFDHICDKLFPQTSIVLFTMGSDGSRALTNSGQHAHVKAVKISKSGDTVGAGDCFLSGIIKSLYEDDLMEVKKLASVGEQALEKALLYASAVAAINCQRAGCEPPTRAETIPYIATKAFRF